MWPSDFSLPEFFLDMHGYSFGWVIGKKIN
jgi:hypothetical protein